MSRSRPRRRVRWIFLLAAVVACQSPREHDGSRRFDRPNVILFFTDDQGYADVGCFGARGWNTPHLDRLAAGGMKLTSFYVAQAACSASRAALLTGCYSNRVGVRGALGPQATSGLHPAEDTIADVVKRRGYATGIFGKWTPRPPRRVPAAAPGI